MPKDAKGRCQGKRESPPRKKNHRKGPLAESAPTVKITLDRPEGCQGLDTCAIKVSEMLEATTWDFDLIGETWIEKKVMVNFPAGHKILNGGIRTCKKMILISDDNGKVRKSVAAIRRSRNGNKKDYVYSGRAQLYVAKSYKKDQNTNVFYDELMTQSVAEAYAQQFNRADRSKAKDGKRLARVGILPVSVMRLGRSKRFYNIEPFLPGRYQKFNDNFDYVHPSTRFVQSEDNSEMSKRRLDHVLATRKHSQLAQAFSHFTYHWSRGKCIVVDIQGVGSYYTDPQIHTYDGRGFGLGNLGQRGINAFIKHHRCYRDCKHLNLPKITEPYDHDSPDAGSELSESIYQGSETMISQLHSSITSSDAKHKSKKDKARPSGHHEGLKVDSDSMDVCEESGKHFTPRRKPKMPPDPTQSDCKMDYADEGTMALICGPGAIPDDECY